MSDFKRSFLPEGRTRLVNAEAFHSTGVICDTLNSTNDS